MIPDLRMREQTLSDDFSRTERALVAGLRRSLFACLLILGSVFLPRALEAHTNAPGSPWDEPGSSLRISVITFGPGDVVFERFGHNMLRVQDIVTGEDLSYNWGMFSFDQPGFLRRFLSGDTQYWVEAFPTQWMLDIYIGQNRTAHEQELALTPEQRFALAEFVRTNALEENKYYRYDYFLDNCSTRLRDALDIALDGSLRGRFEPMRTEWTYRSEATRLMTPEGLTQAGMDVALGPRADVPLTAWESMFIPMRLRDFLRDVTVPTTDGHTMPLVLTERVLHVASGREPEPVERRGLKIGAWGPILGAWMLILAPVSVAARKRTRIPAAVMTALWYGITGLIGVILLGMWVGSAHTFWYENFNIFLLSPLGLVAAVPVTLAVLSGRMTRFAKGLVIAVAGMALLSLLLSLFVSQKMAGPLLLFLPAHLGLVVAVWRHTRPQAVP